MRIDPATARVLASIPVRRAIGVAFGDGEVWVMTEPPSRSKKVFLPSRKHPGTVVRIDLGTNRVFSSPVRVPGLQPISVAFASGSAWVADYYDSTVSRVDVLEQTPPAPGFSASSGFTIGARIHFPSPGDVVEAFGSIWVRSWNERGLLRRIDRAVNKIVASIDLGTSGDGQLAMATAACWGA